VRKVLIILGSAVLLLVIVWYGVGAALPTDYKVSRSIDIAADPEKVYQLVGHLDRWPEWTPWTAEKYPDIVYTYPGAREGTGAVQTWTMDAGSGRLEITAAEPSRGISYDLSFDEGEFASVGIIAFATDSSKPGVTSVTWSDQGKLESTMKRWFGLFLDSLMGAQFEEGLATLKARAEEKAKE
jgi:uncharacterized protein YndB with AHSA1/START domain